SVPKEIMEKCTYMTPNEIELEDMLQVVSLETIKQKLMVTLGSLLVSYYAPGDERHAAGYGVALRDTTGAGDTSNAALAAMLAKGWSVLEAIRFANAAAACSITKEGAQSGMPTFDEVQCFIEENQV